MTSRLLCLALMMIHLVGVAQVRGLVRGIRSQDTVTLNGAKVKLLRARSATFTDANGKFELFLGKKTPDTLVVLAVGYLPDTVVLTQEDRFTALSLMLFSDLLKPEVIVERKAKNGIVKLSIVQMERISSNELRRAACCNLSESFETNASVDVNLTDAVSGARKIQLLGLDGVYTQFQLDNVPFLRGLETAFGMNTFSGIWLEGIQISKGTGSVVNGHESMAGLINLSVKHPFESERFLVNVYGNRFGRGEMNAILSQKFNKRWASALLLNGALNQTVIDENRDGFLDLPQFKNVSALNKWQFNGERMEAQFSVYGYYDDRFAGQSPFSPALYPFHMALTNQHLEATAKTGFFGSHHGESLGIINHVKVHRTVGYFGGNAIGGQRISSGEEKRYYLSINYDRSSTDGKHTLKSGVSTTLLDITQQADFHILQRKEMTIGPFVEYALLLNRFSLQSGLRLDYHSLFGWFFVPRIHAKYALTPKTDLRITAGKGWRVPNFLIENNSLMASNKNWVLPTQGVLPEISWNVGGSVVTEFQMFKRKATLTFDGYYTWFERQLNIDRDVSQAAIVFSYIENQSKALACQAELDWVLSKQFSLRGAYKFLSVRSIYDGTMQQQTMIPMHRLLITTSWSSKNKRWQADLTTNIVGPMRMPHSLSIDKMAYSPWYPYVFGQVSHQWKQIKAYIGLENILNTKQPNPIISSQDPQNPSFDATMVWGPITGINIYGGISYILKHKNYEK
ncbi:MAG: TonB-dependent receptor [Flavobacteriia bacterium]|nr:TonB-dependent receptor [Flavobacteriia bacterium]